MVSRREDEEWRYVFNFPEYLVSSLGSIRRAEPTSGRPVPLFADEDGNVFVVLTVDGNTRHQFRLDRIVAASFLGSIRGRLSMDLVHIDGDPNNCRIDNPKRVERRRDDVKDRDNRSTSQSRSAHRKGRPR